MRDPDNAYGIRLQSTRTHCQRDRMMHVGPKACARTWCTNSSHSSLCKRQSMQHVSHVFQPSERLPLAPHACPIYMCVCSLALIHTRRLAHMAHTRPISESAPVVVSQLSPPLAPPQSFHLAALTRRQYVKSRSPEWRSPYTDSMSS